MSKNISAALVAAVLSSVVAVSAAHAQSIPAEEAQQLTNSTQPDVDPGASKGKDVSIVTQERMQLGNATGPKVRARAEKGGESIPSMEKEGLE